ncbi:MAG: NAD(P)-dependent alcohol dehydrogenase [Acidobacteria bacterium]|nr:NAD(P)-dependent alcohol dehydrogenase [Acidobacteriota bacterium]
MRARGYAARSAQTPLAPFQFERRTPGARDVHIRIDFCGICHSDIHAARNEWGGTLYPCVPGHEIIGRVVETGKDARRFKEGQRVGVGCFVDSCRVCSHCTAGHENYCEKGVTTTYGSLEADGKTPTFGGYSNLIVVDEHFVLSLPDGLDAAASAPLLCAGITTYAPLREAGVTRGSRVAVMGLGGLGHMAVKLAASFGAEVTVLSHSPRKAEDARRLGAREFVLADRPRALAGLAGRYDAIVDTISARHDISGPLNCLRREGTLILVGASPEPLAVSPFSLIAGHRTILGSLVGGMPQTQEMLDYCGSQGITSDIEMTPPDRINEAYDRACSGDVKYRFVIDCAQF